ncbi:SRPBCC family protein [Cellulomonas shaoxiangyii]|uniref:SRPBCC domain-containing protein n=1 Tax=Cellulomonas shaoxiangyii TaxID=2566013 RepID=A0A4P7SIR0_9CELL|nr:SRPBCC domain-containing protein [Cellulomonas shaoxiangyii]QCB94129.1 SRPBCC domain-containing protein [Cellulomonas shaoxiangyii]TGY86622.1 SRPBCC domain-containing protein [Cellulomonas shaoxiangyii]
MTVTRTTTDPEALTLTLVADLAAPPERAWDLWADPRRLERWWGPPTWPATFDSHDLRPGGVAKYHMTGPAGEVARGHWRFVAVDAPHRLELDDAFADDDGEPTTTVPAMRMVVTLEPAGAGTTMTVTTQFAGADVMEQMLATGMAEGMAQAFGQIDAALAAA